MTTRINSLFIAMCALLFMLFASGAHAGPPSDDMTYVANVEGEIWQGTRDGQPGQGSLFYRLEFGADNQVVVTKQSGGFNHSEPHAYRQEGNQVIIESSSDALIGDFDGATMTFYAEDRMLFEIPGDQFKVHKWYAKRAYGHVFFVLIGLMLLNELCRRVPKSNYVIFFILPVVLLPLWLSYDVTYWFKWIKLYSVVGAAALFTLIRFTKVGNMKWAKFGAAAFLVINISEAVAQDFSMGLSIGAAANILNAIGGILSIITLTAWAKIYADKSKERDMIWPAMTSFWIIAYDVWNIVFVYLNFPGSAAAQFMVLVAATLPAMLIKPGTWLQARAITLAGSFMYYFSNPAMFESNVVMLPRTDNLMLAAGLASFVINGVLAVTVFGPKLKARQAAKMA
ncbi:MAG: DUF5692 family protein [Moritella sp.]|uniref:DUF5692 family protein n=1 Tax=Moritella sp. TaxID=78556 RepID=UPI00299FC84E|nr:DUF5692 family protein [Moritella sp.]MDX2319813.1 DUF5692 family protein [Moritella sp.]